MSVKITGNLEGLNKIAANAKELKKRGQVNFNEVVSTDFIQAHTDFESLDDIFEKAGFKVLTKEDFEAVPQDAIDSFIRENTKFNDFTHLQKEAAAEFVRKNIFKGLK